MKTPITKETRFKKLLGRKIRALRIKFDMTQMDLARILGYESTGMISQVESGLKGMDNEKILKAADLFGIHPSFFYGDNEMTDEQIDMLINLYTLLANPENVHYDLVKAALKVAAKEISNKR